MDSTTSRRRRSLAVVGLFAPMILAVFGCGRHLPTEPAVDTPARERVVETDATVLGASDRVVITPAAGASADAIAAQHGALVTSSLRVGAWECDKLVSVTGEDPLSLAARLAQDPRVVLAERDGSIEPSESRQQSFAFDDGFGSAQAVREQASIGSIGLADAHEVSRGTGIRVAILDTGAEITHPLFARRIVGGQDFIDGDADPSEAGNGIDDDGDGRVDEAIGHGTHVAGVVAVVAPEAELLIVRVLDGDGRGDLATVTAGVRWAVAHGARVLNLSLGALDHSDLIQSALEQVEDAGVVVVAAAGNWGAEDPEEYPARSSHALGIAAVDAAGRPAGFSSYGSHIVLSAPGVDVRSAFTGGGFAIWSGTSMAVPFVSGTVALLLARHPDWGQDEVRSRLRDTAKPLVATPSGLADKFGDGVLDAAAALAPDAMNPGGDVTDMYPDGPGRN